uniref:Uncharacterized protein n=1 Tax=Toxoplasma gondii COUG TaxID=1074873 RepID=A0A2G8XRJ0_TOXGO|nr:hypothetical protein TGCOUG_292950 [Toxoplasma gondii COUG]
MVTAVPNPSKSASSTANSGIMSSTSVPASASKPFPGSAGFSLKGFLLDEEIKVQQERLQQMLQLRQQQLNQESRDLAGHPARGSQQNVPINAQSPSLYANKIALPATPHQRHPVCPADCEVLQSQRLGFVPGAPPSRGSSMTSLKQSTYCDYGGAQSSGFDMAPALERGEAQGTSTSTSFTIHECLPALSPGFPSRVPAVESADPFSGRRTSPREFSVNANATRTQVLQNGQVRVGGGNPFIPQQCHMSPHSESDALPAASRASECTRVEESNARVDQGEKMSHRSLFRDGQQGYSDSTFRSSKAATPFSGCLSSAAGAATDAEKEGERTLMSLNRGLTRLDLSRAVYQRMKTVDVQRGTESALLEEVEDVLLRGTASPGVEGGGGGDTRPHSYSDCSAADFGRSSSPKDDCVDEDATCGDIGGERAKVKMLAEKLQAQEEEKRTMQEESFQVEQLLKRQYYQDMRKKNAENEDLKKQLGRLREEVDALNRHLSATLQHKDQLQNALALAQDALTHAVDSMVFTPRPPSDPLSSRSQPKRDGSTRNRPKTHLLGDQTPSTEFTKNAEADTEKRTSLKSEQIRGRDPSVESFHSSRSLGNARSAENGQDGASKEQTGGMHDELGGCGLRTGETRTTAKETQPSVKGSAEDNEDSTESQEGEILCGRLWSLMNRLEKATKVLDPRKLDAEDQKALTVSLLKTRRMFSADNQSAPFEGGAPLEVSPLKDSNFVKESSPTIWTVGVPTEEHRIGAEATLLRSDQTQLLLPASQKAMNQQRSNVCGDRSREERDGLTEEQVKELQNEVITLRQNLQKFTGDVAAAQKKNRRTTTRESTGSRASLCESVDEGRGLSTTDELMIQRLDELQKLNARLLLDNTVLHQLCTGQASPVRLPSVPSLASGIRGPLSLSVLPAQSWNTTSVSASPVPGPVLQPSACLVSLPVAAPSSSQGPFPDPQLSAGTDAKRDAVPRALSSAVAVHMVPTQPGATLAAPPPQYVGHPVAPTASSGHHQKAGHTLASTNFHSLFPGGFFPEKGGTQPHTVAPPAGLQVSPPVGRNGENISVSGQKDRNEIMASFQREMPKRTGSKGPKVQELWNNSTKASQGSQRGSGPFPGVHANGVTTLPVKTVDGDARRVTHTRAHGVAHRQMAVSQSQPVLGSSTGERQDSKKVKPTLSRSVASVGGINRSGGAGTTFLPPLVSTQTNQSKNQGPVMSRGETGGEARNEHGEKSLAGLQRRMVKHSISAVELPVLRSPVAEHIVSRATRGSCLQDGGPSPSKLPHLLTDNYQRIHFTSSGIATRTTSPFQRGAKSVASNSPDTVGGVVARPTLNGVYLCQVPHGRTADPTQLAVWGRGYPASAVGLPTAADSSFPKVFQRNVRKASKGDETSRTRGSQRHSGEGVLWAAESGSRSYSRRRSGSCVSRAPTEAEGRATSGSGRTIQGQTKSEESAVKPTLHSIPVFAQSQLKGHVFPQLVNSSPLSSRPTTPVTPCTPTSATPPPLHQGESSYYTSYTGSLPCYVYSPGVPAPISQNSGDASRQHLVELHPNSTVNFRCVAYPHPTLSTTPVSFTAFKASPSKGTSADCRQSASLSPEETVTEMGLSRPSVSQSDCGASGAAAFGSDASVNQAREPAACVCLPSAAATYSQTHLAGGPFTSGLGFRERLHNTGEYRFQEQMMSSDQPTKRVPRQNRVPSQSTVSPQNVRTPLRAPVTAQGDTAETRAGLGRWSATASKREGVSPTTRAFRPFESFTSFLQKQFMGFTASRTRDESFAEVTADQAAARGRSLTSPVRGKPGRVSSVGGTGLDSSECKKKLLGVPDRSAAVRVGRTTSLANLAQGRIQEKDLGTRLHCMGAPQKQSESLESAVGSNHQQEIMNSARAAKAMWLPTSLGTTSTAVSHISSVSSKHSLKASLCGLKVFCDAPILQHSSIHHLCEEAASQGSLISTPKLESDVSNRRTSAPVGRFLGPAVSVSSVLQLKAR